MTHSTTIPIAWLHITGYAHDWLSNEYGGSVRLYGKPVVSIAHLSGAKDILRMETVDDMAAPEDSRLAMSAMRMDCMEAGIALSPETIRRMYGMTAEQLKMFVPIECPKMALTKYGVLRPWNRTTSFGKRQAMALNRLLMKNFWQAIEDYNTALCEAGKAPGTAISVIEGFCEKTGTGEIWIEDLRREWQRRVARNKSKPKC